MKILLPLAGETPFFSPAEFPFPKPLIEVAGEPMVARAVSNLASLSPDARFVFVAMREEAIRFSFENIFRLITNNRSETVLLGGRTAGALCSCLMAVDQIDLDAPLVIANYDQIIEADVAGLTQRFDASGAAAGVITFPANHPRWSYVLTDGDQVIEASEKQVISRQAIAGFYWFRTGRDFIEAAEATILAGEAVDGNYYIAHSLNHVILAGKSVIALPIRSDQLHSFYIPQRLEAYERELEAGRHMPNGHVNVVIPAAGEGSRFAAAGYTAAKPFIDVLGAPMIGRVLENVGVPGARKTLLVRARDAAQATSLFGREDDVAIQAVDTLTEGTACTVLLARHLIDNDAPLIIANSDQLLDFSCQDYLDDALRRGLDGSILVFRDAALDPKWSFARVDEQGLVREVAEKAPISDLATAGIYMFTRGSDFVKAAIDMIARNERVNNEFYTCPVYNHLIRQGARIGVYEVSPAAMRGLGIPEDLESYIREFGGAEARSRHHPSAAVVEG
jgi:NDP-sugar pyrophosphorylase family protein